MPSFPLQEELIDAIVQFAGAVITHPKDAVDCFKGAWRPTDLPSLRQCRSVQRDVRAWLDGAPYEAVLAYAPRPDIRLVGTLGASIGTDAGEHGISVTWDWFIVEAPLRAVSALAVVSVYQEGLGDRIGPCSRNGCPNYYFDRNKRGRKYCKTKECDDARNRDRVKQSRGSS